MNYRQWKKRYKKLHGVNPPLELDKRKQRRLAKNVKAQTAKDALFHRARKAGARMTNIFLIIVILLLVDIYGQLKKINERQGKEDAGNND